MRPCATARMAAGTSVVVFIKPAPRENQTFGMA